MSRSALTVGAGMVFGAALAASEVYLPSVIVSQMELKDYHMLNVFLSASASSAYVIISLIMVMAAFKRLNIVRRQPRQESSFGWCGSYGANVFGGLLLGVGMALTGACPGTVLVQVATGIKSGILTALGGLTGAIFFVRFGAALKRNLSASTYSPEAKALTIDTKFDMNPDHVLLAYEIFCLALIGAVSVLGPNQSAPLLPPIVGGALIGGAQATSLLFTGKAVGVSTAYEEAGRFFWHLLASEKQGHYPPSKAILFALGIFLGSFTLLRSISYIIPQDTDISSTRALLGGFAMVFGARVAGGCTSGHGISGMSTFSISSIITVIAMFGGGILTARLLPSVFSYFNGKTRAYDAI